MTTSDITAPARSTRWRNWGGNQQAVAREVRTPGSVEEVAALEVEHDGGDPRHAGEPRLAPP